MPDAGSGPTKSASKSSTCGIPPKPTGDPEAHAQADPQADAEAQEAAEADARPTPEPPPSEGNRRTHPPAAGG